MFDHFLINYVGNVLVILLALLTYLLYVAHKESMSKTIRVIGCYFYQNVRKAPSFRWGMDSTGKRSFPCF